MGVMKRVGFFAILVLFVCTGLFAQGVSLDQAVTESARTIESKLLEGSRVAILVFTSQTQAFSDYILDELATAISASGKIQVIDRQHMDAVRRELNIQMQGDVSDSEVRRVGQQLGAQYVVTGSLVDIGTAYRFRVTAIDVESAVREGSSSRSIHFEDTRTVFLLTGQRPTPSAPPAPPAPPTLRDRVGTITNVRFTFSGGVWYRQSDGRRMSPFIGHNQTTVTRVNFTTTAPNATLVIHLGVSSESNYDFAFVGRLNTAASRTAYSERISGESTRTITIQVPTAGNHFVEIGYTKDGSRSRGEDRAWFRLVY